MTTYTPGPYRTEDANSRIRIYGAGDVLVGYVEIHAEPEITLGNMRLLRAAPDLLEALQGVLLTENDTHRQSDDRWSVFRQAARAAIAKAIDNGARTEGVAGDACPVVAEGSALGNSAPASHC